MSNSRGKKQRRGKGWFFENQDRQKASAQDIVDEMENTFGANDTTNLFSDDGRNGGSLGGGRILRDAVDGFSPIQNDDTVTYRKGAVRNRTTKGPSKNRTVPKLTRPTAHLNTTSSLDKARVHQGDRVSTTAVSARKQKQPTNKKSTDSILDGLTKKRDHAGRNQLRYGSGNNVAVDLTGGNQHNRAHPVRNPAQRQEKPKIANGTSSNLAKHPYKQPRKQQQAGERHDNGQDEVQEDSQSRHQPHARREQQYSQHHTISNVHQQHNHGNYMQHQQNKTAMANQTNGPENEKRKRQLCNRKIVLEDQDTEATDSSSTVRPDRTTKKRSATGRSKSSSDKKVGHNNDHREISQPQSKKRRSTTRKRLPESDSDGASDDEARTTSKQKLNGESNYTNRSFRPQTHPNPDPTENDPIVDDTDSDAEAKKNQASRRSSSMDDRIPRKSGGTGSSHKEFVENLAEDGPLPSTAQNKQASCSERFKKTKSTKVPDRAPRRSSQASQEAEGNNQAKGKPQGTTHLGLTKQNGGPKKKPKPKPATPIKPGASLRGSVSSSSSSSSRPSNSLGGSGSSSSRRSNSLGGSGSSGSRRSNRTAAVAARMKSRSKGKGETGDVIELLSDDDENDNDVTPTKGDTNDTQAETETPTETQPNTRSLTKRFRQDVPRFALGKRVYSEKNQVTFEKGLLQLADGSKDALSKSNKCKAKISFKDDAVDDLLELKYYLRPEASPVTNDESKEDEQPNHLSFLAMKIRPNKENMLKTLRNAYNPGDTDDHSKHYVVIEFASRSHLEDLIQRMQHDGDASLFIDNAELTLESAGTYRLSLTQADAVEEQQEAKRQKTKRKYQRGGPKVTDAFVAKRSQDTILLVYPFAGDPVEIEKAAEGLTEASGKQPVGGNEEEICQETDASSVDPIRDGINSISLAASSSSDEEQKLATTSTTAAAAPAKTEQRRHYLTIQVRDFERLCPGEFLNDTLIDFWLQWITRKLDPRDENAIHCFSSHFFTTLVDEGVSAVTKWTAKRGINVFEKKFVFIPINEALHWSLCVVVNPGCIDKEGDDEPMSCLLFLDSLKAHRKKKVSKKVREWLNSEWKRIRGGDESGEQDPFLDDHHCPLLDPKIPYQNNSWDCGVFVCRYAYAVLSIRDKPFNRGEDWFKRDLKTNCDRFKFGMEEIARLRDDIRVLIERLSTIYVPWKEKEDKESKEARKAKRQRVRQKKEAEELLPKNMKTNLQDDGKRQSLRQEEETEALVPENNNLKDIGKVSMAHEGQEEDVDEIMQKQEEPNSDDRMVELAEESNSDDRKVAALEQHDDNDVEMAATEPDEENYESYARNDSSYNAGHPGAAFRNHDSTDHPGAAFLPSESQAREEEEEENDSTPQHYTGEGLGSYDETDHDESGSNSAVPIPSFRGIDDEGTEAIEIEKENVAYHVSTTPSSQSAKKPRCSHTPSSRGRLADDDESRVDEI